MHSSNIVDNKEETLTDDKAHQQDPRASPSSSTPTPLAKSPYPASARPGASSKRPRRAWCNTASRTNRALEACGSSPVIVSLPFSVRLTYPTLPFLSSHLSIHPSPLRTTTTCKHAPPSIPVTHDSSLDLPLPLARPSPSPTKNCHVNLPPSPPPDQHPPTHLPSTHPLIHTLTPPPQTSPNDPTSPSTSTNPAPPSKPC